MKKQNNCVNVIIQCSEYLFLIGLIVIPFALTAQTNLFQFEHLTIDDGLSHSKVNCILQDSRGFMWFGTNDGLDRYNGYKITEYQYNLSDSGSITHNLIRDIHEDSHGNLWVATDAGGLNLYDRDFDRFLEVPEDLNCSGGPISKNVNAIAEDQAGILWIGTRDGLTRFDPVEYTIKNYSHDPEDRTSLSHNFVRCVYVDSQNRIWVGTDGGGLNRFRRETQTFQHSENKSGGLEKLSSAIHSIFEDGNGNIWVGADTAGAFRFRPESGEAEEIGGVNGETILTIRAFHEDDDGRFWIGSREGLYIYNPDDGRMIKYTHTESERSSLTHKSVQHIFRDAAGDVWIGTRGGVDYLNKNTIAFNHFPAVEGSNHTLNSRVVFGIEEDDNGNLWIGTESGGINYLDRATGDFTYLTSDPDKPNSISGDNVKTILQGSRGDFWIGTFAHGLNRYDPDSDTFTHFLHDPENPRSLSNNDVYSIVEDDNGDLWMTTHVGVSVYRRDTGDFDRYVNVPGDPTSLSHNDCNLVYKDNDGVLWVGTFWGLNRFNTSDHTFTRYTSDPNDKTTLSSSFVQTIQEDSKGRFWIGTQGGGLNLFNRETGQAKAFTERDGLPNNSIYGILEDDAGNLWLSTNNGICRFNPETGDTKNYDATDGLQGNQFNYNAYYKTSAGELIFGGMNGFTLFRPEEVRDETYSPPIVITDFKIFNQSVPIRGENSPLEKHISETAHITITHDQSVITFEFAALSYAASQKNQYAYKLEDFEQNWNYVGTRQTATYTNLPAGDYTFRVRGSNNHGVWNDEGISLAISVTPPFWETLGFRGAVILLLGGIIYLGYRLRTRNMVRQNQRLEAINRRLNTQISERKKAESKIRKFRHAIEQAPMSVIIMDKAGRVEYTNPQFLEVSGYTEEEVRELGEEIVIRKEQAPELAQEMWAAVTAGKTWRKEFKNTRRDGTEFWEFLTIGPILDNRGSITHFVALKEEITERKELEEQLLQSQKMQAIGRLAGGVAHDFNNILTVIQGYSSLALNEIDESNSQHANLQRVHEASEKAQALTSQLLAFSRKQQLQPKIININSLVQNLEGMLQRLLGEDIHLDIQCADGLNDVRVDPGQLEQVLLNLAVNSRDAMPSGGTISIATQNVFFADTEIREDVKIAPGSYVELAVGDTGIGMDQETLEKIYEPFFTTKSRSRGTGLGLSTVYGIVKQSDGYISAESTPGKGTTFRIYLQTYSTTAPESAEVHASGMALTGNETVLAIEDEKEILYLTEKGLQHMGYTVLTASNGTEAVELYSEQAEEIDVIITDVVLPDIVGPEVAQRIREINPAARIIFMSGYTDDILTRHGIDIETIQFLQKPFTIDEIARRIRNIMDDREQV
ncbi:MAG: PAS domain S-box protein [Candidatus Marinimicrobia bacterium]|nr:PAS domain S-box protein [Candidatus Neomarinimicrobiota bacterium]MCF7829316.1 PAS domain S-box protein [Candidatus Neomarinimicrobiota bacterium]MCF7880022.1 PAS domain S-box protein [Candidatus Neomarinimicrobiota bacterium]